MLAGHGGRDTPAGVLVDLFFHTQLVRQHCQSWLACLAGAAAIRVWSADSTASTVVSPAVRLP